MHLLFRVLVLNIVFIYVISDDATKVAETLERRVKLFGDAILGFSDIEQIYSNDTIVSFLNFTAWNHVDEIVQILEERLTKIVDVLKDNKDVIEKAHGSNEFKVFHDPDLCCNVQTSDLELDLQFNRMVAKSLCFLRSGSVSSKSLDKTYTSVFRDNSEKSMFLLWQYFGDASGNYFQYPAKKSACDGKAWNDPRFQQWFVHTVVPKKKNVVIVLDTSGSMSSSVNGINSSVAAPTRSMVAQEAAMTVLGTLGTTDHVGVVIFNISAVSSTCSPTLDSQGIHMMVPATRDNMGSIENLITSSIPAGGTYYGNAFLKAFQLLSRSKQIDPKRFEDSLDMILFLTDGMPEDSTSDILEELASGQNLMDHSVHVFMYALGNEFKHTNTPRSFLVQLADQNNLVLNNSFVPQWPILSSLQDNNKPVGPVGNISFIGNADGQRLSQIMGEYYSHFQVVSGANVTFSVPQREPNTGLKMTLSLPVLDNGGQFLGVTALDVLLELTFYEVAHFHLGKDSYAFLVGDSGVVYLHPELALGDTDLEVYTLDQFEPGLSPDAIYNITNGREGQEVIKKSVDQTLKSAVCYYKPLSGFSANFTVVVVIFEDDIKQKRLQSADSNSFPDFLYHRQGFINTSVVGHDGVCYRDQALVIPANATIKFAPGSFWDLEKSLMYEQNKSYSEAHSSFKNTTGFSQHAGVSESVAGDVLLMNKIDEHWKVPTDAIWRYIGTENGVFKVFPGTLVPDILYDPREDRWYTAAVGQSQKYMFITHPNQNTSIVTLAKAFYQTSKLVHGVIAADITVQHLMTFLYNTALRVSHFTDTAWIIMDDKGSLLMKLDHTGPVQISAHLTEILPGVANWLLQKGVLQIDWCTDVLTGHAHLSYSLDTSGSVVDSGSSDPCLSFKLVAVPNSNLYVVIYKPSTTCKSSQTLCSCKEMCSVCDHQKRHTCQCPCKCSSTYMDRCTHQINKTSGYRPCPGPHKHWQMQSSDSTNKSSTVQPCKPVCTAISGSSECLAAKGCNWCSGGHYKKLSLCSERCVRDRQEVQYKLACENSTFQLNWTALESKVLQIAKKKLKLSSRAVVQPQVSRNGKAAVSVMVGTSDESEVPLSWLTMLSDPIQVTVSDGAGQPTNLYLVTNLTKPTDARVELEVRGVNLTHRLETALTLRNYLQKQVLKLVEGVTTTEIVRTVSGIWPEEDRISFWLEKPKDLKPGDFMVQLQNLMALNGSYIDTLGRNETIGSVTVSHHYSSLCPTNCSRSVSPKDCNTNKACVWDKVYQECTATPVLPERIHASAYFPCLGLYQKLSDSEEIGALQNFKRAVKNMTHLSDRALHSFNITQMSRLVGRVFNFTIQGVLYQNRVSAIWWDLEQQLDRTANFVLTIGNQTFTSSTRPTTYAQITNMEVDIEFPSLDTDWLLQTHPLTARNEIEQEVVRIAKETMSPMVTKTISNIALFKNTVKFMVSKQPEDPRDLPQEHATLRDRVNQGLLDISLFGRQYTANYTFFIGSFSELCPRQCHQATQESACSTIPGCYWSYELQRCSDDVTLPEKKQVTVVFPCVKLDELPEGERNRSLEGVRTAVGRFLQGLPAGAQAHSFRYGQDFRSSFTFEVQGTAWRAPLSSLLYNISSWIGSGQLQITINNTQVTGQDVEDFNSVEIAMLFPNVDFSKLELLQRRKLKLELFHQLRSLLSNGFSLTDIHDVWFDQKYIIFKVKRDNSNSSISSEIEKWKQVLKLKAFSITLDNGRHQPAKMVYQASLHGNCPISCYNSSMNVLCRRSQGCFFKGSWNVAHCQKTKLISNSFAYLLFVPCNGTQSLSPTEKSETEQDLRVKLEAMLGGAKEVLQDVILSEDGADVVLHATTLHPHLELYVDTLKTKADYTQGFSFGPSSERNKFSPRNREDSTNVEMVLKFSSIDLEALQNLHLTTRGDISDDLQHQVNSLLLGEVAQTFNLTWIKQDKLSFEMKKSTQSKINMVAEVEKIQRAVKQGQIVLHVHYIRPIVATEASTQRTFKELCPEKYQTSTSPPPLKTTVTSLNTNYSTVTPPNQAPSLIVVYNASEMTRAEADAVVLNTVHTCLIEIHSCESCMSRYSRNSCSFDPLTTDSPPSTTHKMNETTPAISQEEQIHLGAVTITIIATSGCFLLALALWTADYVRKATTKKSKFKRKQHKIEMDIQH